jgi:hypothetical protein
MLPRSEAREPSVLKNAALTRAIIPDKDCQGGKLYCLAVLNGLEVFHPERDERGFAFHVKTPHAKAI